MDSKTQGVTAQPSNAFTRLLSQFRDGESLQELSTALTQLVQAVKETGKPGKLTYTITLKPASDAIVVTDAEPKLTLPKVDRKGSMFFANEACTLVQDNPKQQKLAFREVMKPEPEVRDLSAKAEPTVVAVAAQA